MRIQDRIIGRFTGHKKGPLLITLGGMHGNEYAGIHAINIVLKMLEVEPLANPDFKYSGRFVGIAGNLGALKQNTRYQKQDLNRMWTEKTVNRIMSQSANVLKYEEHEVFFLLETIKQEIKKYNAEKVYILDLHTTTAGGGIFSLPSEKEESLFLAQKMHAPVILGFLENIKGTTLHYFNTENLGVDTTIVTFEAGQHYERLSVHRAVSAIVNFMRSINSVRNEDVENYHDDMLKEYAEGLPKVAELIYAHSVKEEDDFVMKPGYDNFQPIEKGELLAHDKNGEIHAPEDGLILMPLYQSQGEDGFFILKKALT